MKKQTFVLLLAILAGFGCCGNEDKPNPVTTIRDPLTYDEGVLINGVKWATRNVDAPGTFTAKPEDPGMFYQWNSKVGWSADASLVSTDSSTWNSDWDGGLQALDSGSWNAAHDPCPAGWRVPSLEEVNSLYDTKKTIKYNPVYVNTGALLNDSLFIHYSGTFIKGGIIEQTNRGFLWTATMREDSTVSAICFETLLASNGNQTYAYIVWGYPSYGVNVRCVSQ